MIQVTAVTPVHQVVIRISQEVDQARPAVAQIHLEVALQAEEALVQVVENHSALTTKTKMETGVTLRLPMAGDSDCFCEFELLSFFLIFSTFKYLFRRD